jgi:t-SNARE complex subunit (syntaxin)
MIMQNMSDVKKNRIICALLLIIIIIIITIIIYVTVIWNGTFHFMSTHT